MIQLSPEFDFGHATLLCLAWSPLLCFLHVQFCSTLNSKKLPQKNLWESNLWRRTRCQFIVDGLTMTTRLMATETDYNTSVEIYKEKTEEEGEKGKEWTKRMRDEPPSTY